MLREQLDRLLGDSFSIERELEGAGQSRVFVAEERALGRSVVLKVLPPRLTDGVDDARFQREVRVAARLQHPNIVPLLAAGMGVADPDGQPRPIRWFSMPYIEGETLRDRLVRRGALPLPEALRLLRELASAIAYAHERGIVHRDLKPENVLLSHGVAMISDFGVAKALDDASEEAVRTGRRLTSVSMALGTPLYSAPEQIGSARQVDHRADLYTFGTVAYEMLAGSAPFAGRSLRAILVAQAKEPPAPLASQRPDVPADLVDCIMRCLAKRPDDRPQSAREIVQLLDALSTDGLVATGTHAARASTTGAHAAASGTTAAQVARATAAETTTDAATTPSRRTIGLLILAMVAIALAVLLLSGLRADAQPPSPTPSARRSALPDPQRAVAIDRDFARLVSSLSEAGGYFDTDNLISNERSYLHVVGALERHGARGGAYIGVGPDQNFSYIAHVRPSVAFIIDIRRDNLLQHLMFKALFARSRTRAEYLALWLGRPVPTDVERWRTRPIDALVAHFDTVPSTPASAHAARAAVLAEVQRSGVPLSAADLATITRFHSAFVESGLALRFTTTGQPPRWYYPTLRDLLTERDLEGRQAGYLAREEDFQFLKALQARHGVVPVVGDLAGPHALAAIGREVARRGERVSALYVSNVEDYLLRDGRFAAYAATIAALPRAPRGVVIRSLFVGEGGHAMSIPGYYSTQLLQSLDTLVSDVRRAPPRSYRELAGRPHLPLTAAGAPRGRRTSRTSSGTTAPPAGTPAVRPGSPP